MKYNIDKIKNKAVQITAQNRDEVREFLEALDEPAFSYMIGLYYGATFGGYSTIPSGCDIITIEEMKALAANKPTEVAPAKESPLRGCFIQLTEDNETELRELLLGECSSAGGWGIDAHKAYYGLIKDSGRVGYTYNNNHPMIQEIITLEEAKRRVSGSSSTTEQPSTYPKLMWVDGVDEKVWVIGEVQGLYAVVASVCRDVDGGVDGFTQNDVKDIQELLVDDCLQVQFCTNVSDSEYRVGQRLYTKDGRVCGNATVVEICETHDRLKLQIDRHGGILWLPCDMISGRFFTSK